MVTALIQKLTTKNKPYFNSIHTGKTLQGKLYDKLTEFPFLTLYSEGVRKYSREPP